MSLDKEDTASTEELEIQQTRQEEGTETAVPADVPEAQQSQSVDEEKDEPKETSKRDREDEEEDEDERECDIADGKYPEKHARTIIDNLKAHLDVKEQGIFVSYAHGRVYNGLDPYNEYIIKTVTKMFKNLHRDDKEIFWCLVTKYIANEVKQWNSNIDIICAICARKAISVTCNWTLPVEMSLRIAAITALSYCRIGEFKAKVVNIAFDYS